VLSLSFLFDKFLLVLFGSWSVAEATAFHPCFCTQDVWVIGDGQIAVKVKPNVIQKFFWW
jgi:hypothetical protein